MAVGPDTVREGGLVRMHHEANLGEAPKVMGESVVAQCRMFQEKWNIVLFAQC
jgi:hypothetical protein